MILTFYKYTIFSRICSVGNFIEIPTPNAHIFNIPLIVFYVFILICILQLGLDRFI